MTSHISNLSFRSPAVLTVSVTTLLFIIIALWQMSDGIAPVLGQNEDPNGVEDRQPSPSPVPASTPTPTPTATPFLGDSGNPGKQVLSIRQRAEGSAPLSAHNSGESDAPEYSASGVKFTAISVGVEHACGVLEDGTLVCWGNNGDNRATPPDEVFKSISAGRRHTCGIKADDTVACWGVVSRTTQREKPSKPSAPATFPAASGWMMLSDAGQGRRRSRWKPTMFSSKLALATDISAGSTPQAKWFVGAPIIMDKPVRRKARSCPLAPEICKPADCARTIPLPAGA